MELDIVDIRQGENNLTKHDINSEILIDDEVPFQNAKQLVGLDDRKNFPR